MSGAFLSLNGTRVVSGHVAIPYYGAWTADVMMPANANAATLAQGASATLAMGNLTLVGTVYRASPFAGQIQVRIVGGKGGWQKPTTAQQYVLAGGVRRSQVLGDLARMVGETIVVGNDEVLGSSFVLEGGTAAGRILRQIAGPLWYIDPSGTTQVQATRPALTISTPFLVNTFDGARGAFEVSTEDYASWRPGATFSNDLVTVPQTISLATIDSDNSGTLRFTVLTVGPPTDRLIEMFRELVREEVEDLTFLGVYEYAVQNVASDGSTVDAIPTSTSIPLPPLRKVPVRSGVPGLTVKPKRGSLLAISFLDGDPTRACILGGFDGANPSSVVFLGADPTTPGLHKRAVVCYGDAVTLGSASGSITATTGADQRIVKVEDALL